MKSLINELKNPFRLVYYAIAIATFKHGAWSFAVVLEGLPPEYNFSSVLSFAGEPTATLLGSALSALAVFFSWTVWGILMTLAADVGVLATSRRLQSTSHRNTLLDWLIFLILSVIVAFSQLYYTAAHTAPFSPVTDVGFAPLDPGGWLYIVLAQRVVWMPVSLPGFLALYTLFFKVEDRAVTPTIKKGDEVYTPAEAAEIAEKEYGHPVGEQRIRQLARAEKNSGGTDAFKDNGRWLIKRELLDKHFS